MSYFDENTVLQINTGNNPPAKPPILLVVAILLLIPGVLSYELVTGQDSHVIAMLIAAIGGLVIIARPFWGLIFFTSLLYIRPEESITAIQGLRLPLIVSLVTIISVFFQKLLKKEPLVKTPLNIMIIGFGIAVILSAIQRGVIDVAALDVSRLVILVFLVLNLVKSPKEYKIFSIAIILLTGYVSIYSIYLYTIGGALLDHGEFRSQATGIFSDPNDLAGTIVAGLGMSLFQARAETKKLRLFYIIMSILFIYSIILTNSRGGLLSLILVLGCYIYISVPKKIYSITILVVMSMIFLLKGGRSTNFDATEESANSRFWFWSTGVEELVHRPLFGVGYGGFPEINGGMTAHNSFVLCFGETGLVGYFFWLGCLYYSLGYFLPKNKKNIMTEKDKLEILGNKLALCGFLFSAFWISRTYIPVLYLLISLPIAKEISCGSYQYKKFLPKRDYINIIVINILSILLIYIIAIKYR
jgi:putative inorganic carbon (hco3(-)) transporter